MLRRSHSAPADHHVSTIHEACSRGRQPSKCHALDGSFSAVGRASNAKHQQQERCSSLPLCGGRLGQRPCARRDRSPRAGDSVWHASEWPQQGDTPFGQREHPSEVDKERSSPKQLSARAPGCIKSKEPAQEALQSAKELRMSGQHSAALAAFIRIHAEHDCHDPAVALEGMACCKGDLCMFTKAVEISDRLIAMQHEQVVCHHMLKVELLIAKCLYDGPAARPASLGQICKHIESVASSPGAADGELRVRLLCAAAQLAAWKDDHTKALSLTCQALLAEPEAVQPMLFMAATHVRLGEPRPALRCIAKAMPHLSSASLAADALLPLHRWGAIAHSIAAEACERLCQSHDAIAHVEAALALDPALPFAHLIRARALHQMGQHVAAHESLEIPLKCPQNWLAKLQLGYMQLCSGDTNAVTTLNEVQRVPGLPRVYAGATKVYLALALSFHPFDSHHKLVREFARQGLDSHSHLKRIWEEVTRDRSLSSDAAAVARRLRKVVDLDLNGPQSRELAYLLADAIPNPRLLQAFEVKDVRPPQPVRSNSKTRGGAGALAQHAASDASKHTKQATAEVEELAVDQEHEEDQQRLANYERDTTQKVLQSLDAQDVVSGQSARVNSGKGKQDELESAPAQRRVLPPLQLCYNQILDVAQLCYGPLLGFGSSAKVFKGTFQGQEVAIKHIEDGIANIEGIRKELAVLRNSHHPRLVAFVGTVIQLPQLILVTEFMKGGSLYERLFGISSLGGRSAAAAAPPLAASHRKILALQVTEGVVALHDHDIVHRDLKSLNILLDHLGNAKICDFGLAQCLSGSHMSRQTGGESGTPRYMSPECFDRSVGKLTKKVDVWALGCVLIELFGNIVPYPDCAALADIVRRIIGERQAPQVPSHVPQQLSSVILKCLAYQPAERPSACEVSVGLWKTREA